MIAEIGQSRFNRDDISSIKYVNNTASGTSYLSDNSLPGQKRSSGSTDIHCSFNETVKSCLNKNQFYFSDMSITYSKKVCSISFFQPEEILTLKTSSASFCSFCLLNEDQLEENVSENSIRLNNTSDHLETKMKSRNLLIRL